MEDEIELIDYIKILVKKKYFILIGTLIGFFFSISYSYTITPSYEAVAKILITNPKIKISSNNKLQTNIRPETSIGTIKELIKNRELLNKLTLSLNDKYPDIEADRLLEMVDVEQVKETFLHIKITDNNRDRAMEIANLWAEYLIDRNSYLYSIEAKKTLKIVSDQLEKAKSNLMKIEKKLKDFNMKNKISYLQAEINSIEGITPVNMPVIMLNGGASNLGESGGGQNFVGSEGLIKYRKRLEKIRILLEKKKAELKSAEIILKRSNDKNIINFIKKTEIEKESLKAEYNQIEREVKNQNERLKSLKKQLEEQIVTRRELSRKKNKEFATYDIFTKKQQELQIALYASDTGAIVIAEKAYAPKHTSNPNKKSIVSITTIISLFLSVFFAFFIEYIQQAFRRAATV